MKNKLAVKEGFEPPVGFPTPVFKTGTLSRSVTSPNIISFYFSFSLSF